MRGQAEEWRRTSGGGGDRDGDRGMVGHNMVGQGLEDGNRDLVNGHWLLGWGIGKSRCNKAART